jgi:hypothetical protein
MLSSTAGKWVFIKRRARKQLDCPGLVAHVDRASLSPRRLQMVQQPQFDWHHGSLTLQQKDTFPQVPSLELPAEARQR